MTTVPEPATERGSLDWWNERYRLRETPWDTGIVPPELHQLADCGLLRPPGVTLDLGCGTGANVLFLANLGFTAIGVDLAWLALTQARRKAQQAGLPALFCIGDAVDLRFLTVQAVFVLDMGCLHGLSAERRDRYVESLARRTVGGALYMLYGFDADRRAHGGPSGFAPGEIAGRFAPYFRLRWHRPSEQGSRPVAWYLLERY